VHLGDINEFLVKLNRGPAATDAAIRETENQLNAELPREYKGFLRSSNGGDGFVGKEYVILWRVDELPSMNQLYEVQKYVPGLLVFGSSGGGEAYGFDTRVPDWPIVRVPFFGMEWAVAEPMGSSFSEFLGQLYETK
jgi:hypothetical protein